MIYADEAFYVESYLLGRKPVVSTGFSFYARQASQVIDQYTFGRLHDMDESEIPEAVRMCCCELAELNYRKEMQKNAAGGKTSEKIGTYSVTFASDKDSAETDTSERHGVIMKWLANTGLCYRGCGYVY